jgi:arylsulfatase A-like enzyme
VNQVKKYAIFIIIAAVVVLIVVFSINRPLKTSARNLIYILVDALRSDHLHCYGYRRTISPNIDKLAEDGILFTNSLSQSCWTKPSFSSIITANHPTSVGMTGMNDALIDNITTVAELLKKDGFYTVAFISNPYLGKEHGFAQGFDEYHAIFPTNLSEYKINADELNREVFKWLDKNKDRKFFLMIFYLEPHTPYAPPEPYNRLFSPISHVSENLWKTKIANPSAEYLNALIDLYDGEISFLDHELGSLFEKLKKLGLWDNSLITFNADHGEEFYDHFWWQHNHTLYEELLKVPLIIKGPGLPHGIKVETPVQHIEIFPTLFDLFGLKQSSTFTGQPVTDLIKDPGNIINKLTYHETYLPGKSFIAVRGIRWKLIYNLEKKTYQFFDLLKDPREKNDLLAADGGASSKHLSPEIIKNFEYFKASLHKLAKQAYKLRHLRRAFRNVKYDREAMRLLEGLGYLSH